VKYQPLQDYLKGVAPGKQHVSLSFEQIEKILDKKLPRSAFTYREWWANQQGGSRAPHWNAAGFRVDAVDLSRKTVRFARTGKTGPLPTTRKASRRKANRRTAAANPMKAEELITAGFKNYGRWALTETGIHFKGKLPREPGVYAHIVNGDVTYIGRSLKGFRHRMGHYKKPGTTQRTSIRINGRIKTALQSGKTVETLAAFPEPTTWSGLPVDVVSGLETGLVAKARPPWNKQGVSG
jgi:hypothetical protein